MFAIINRSFKGRTRLEFSLLTPDEKSTFTKAKSTMSKKWKLVANLGSLRFWACIPGVSGVNFDFMLRFEKTLKRA